MHSEGLDRTITKFIELYGDRTGQKGAGVHGGLAWIGDEQPAAPPVGGASCPTVVKFVLLAARGEDAPDAADWRRMTRLAALAQRLQRPVLLWDMPLQVVAGGTQADRLVINEAIQDCKLALLRLRAPVISVFEERFPVLLESEIAMVDGAVVVSDHQELCVSGSEHLPRITTVGYGKHDLAREILMLLKGASSGNAEDLERKRVAQIREVTMQRD